MPEQPVRVLLIEDEEDDYLLTRRMLSKAEGGVFDLQWIPTYAEALQALRGDQFDVALLDYRLTWRDGLELLREAVAAGCQTPIILLTGKGSYEIDVEAMRAGAVDFLLKDELNAGLLERVIRYAIGRRQAEDALRRARDELEQGVRERTQDLAQAIEGLQDEINGRMRVEADLRESEMRFRQMAENIEEVLWMRDPVQGRTLYVSPRYEALLGVSAQTLYENPDSFIDRVHPDDRERLKAARPRQADGTYDEECRILRPDGELRWVRDRAFPIHDAQGVVYRIVGVTEDITQRKLAEERLRYIGAHDVLTGLYNRFYFEEEVARLERGRKFPVSIVSADVDGLKRVNDRYGHAAGDDLLRRAAQVLRPAFRNEDVVARVGGDEFVVLLPGASPAAAARAVARVRSNLEAHNQQPAGPRLSLSLGTASGDKGCSLAEVLREADRAMYRDKASKRQGPV
jgi:diguanylate cyclase (GGDEF)-like protein/PAS domain S-box-containing protein